MVGVSSGFAAFEDFASSAFSYCNSSTDFGLCPFEKSAFHVLCKHLVVLAVLCLRNFVVFFYGENDPIHFRNLQTSILTLFRVVTLEDWTDVMYDNIHGSNNYSCSEDTVWKPVSSESPIGAAIFFVGFCSHWYNDCPQLWWGYHEQRGQLTPKCQLSKK